MPVLAIDAGGSGSRAAVVADGGGVLGRAEGGPGNAGQPVAALRAALLPLLVRLGPVVAAQGQGAGLRVVAGFAGAGREPAARRAEAALTGALDDAGLVPAALMVRTDAQIALAGVAPVDQGPAAVVIAGTGSIALARGGGLEARAGGLGPHLGDEGGGFWLGRRAVEIACRHADGRAPDAAAFAAAVWAALGLEGPADLVPLAADLWWRPARLAALAPLVLERVADPVAQRLVAEAGRALAELVVAVRSRAALPAGSPTGLGGGLWAAGGPREPLRRALLAALGPEAASTCRPLALPPVLGAATLSLNRAARAALAAHGAPG